MTRPTVTTTPTPSGVLYDVDLSHIGAVFSSRVTPVQDVRITTTHGLVSAEHVHPQHSQHLPYERSYKNADGHIGFERVLYAMVHGMLRPSGLRVTCYGQGAPDIEQRFTRIFDATTGQTIEETLHVNGVLRKRRLWTHGNTANDTMILEEWVAQDGRPTHRLVFSPIFPHGWRQHVTYDPRHATREAPAHHRESEHLLSLPALSGYRSILLVDQAEHVVLHPAIPVPTFPEVHSFFS